MTENLKEDIDLLQKLEEKLRYSDDPKEKLRLQKDIEEVKKRIDYSKEEKEIIATEPFTDHELEIIIRLILSTPPRFNSSDFNVLSINEKMKTNELTENVHFMINMGLAMASEIDLYIQHQAFLKPEFPENLRSTFIQQYHILKHRGFRGNDLFDSLHKFASGNRSDAKFITAGLAILAYFFERCDIFEK